MNYNGRMQDCRSTISADIGYPVSYKLLTKRLVSWYISAYPLNYQK